MDKQHFLGLINRLSTISETEKKLLLTNFKKIEKKAARKDFMLTRLQRDKEIATNILNATIEDLELHKKEIEDVNQLLIEQKLIVEEKSKILEENLQKLKSSYDELEQFSYIASHDLKSPLRTISSFAQLLKRRYYNQLDNDADEFIEFIVSGVQQMNDVIRNSLEYAKVGKDDSIYKTTNLNTILGLAQLNLKEDIEENNAQVLTLEPLPTILASKTSILQLFQNIIGNAIKLHREIPPVLRISYTEIDGNLWQFHITDNGIGISLKYQKNIFLPFKRLHDKKKDGQGIGLAICKKVVENHGGTIHIESQINVGTTVIFTLPITVKEIILEDTPTY